MASTERPTGDDAGTDTAVVSAGARLAATFEHIYRERMAGLPILNQDLGVAVVGGRAWRGNWLGVLVTPWCMNLVLTPLVPAEQARHPEGIDLAQDPWGRGYHRDPPEPAPSTHGTHPAPDSTEQQSHRDNLDLTQDRHGIKRLLDFPAGRFEFTSSPVDDLGTIASCSLFSPMQAFADQAAAEATAAEVMTALFQPDPDATAADHHDPDARTTAAKPGAPGAAISAPPSGPGVSRRNLLRGSFRSG